MIPERDSEPDPRDLPLPEVRLHGPEPGLAVGDPEDGEPGFRRGVLHRVLQPGAVPVEPFLEGWVGKELDPAGHPHHLHPGAGRGAETELGLGSSSAAGRCPSSNRCGSRTRTNRQTTSRRPGPGAGCPRQSR